MLIGVSTHIHVLKPLDRELLKAIREVGFETVELYANHPHWSGYDQVSSRKAIAEACLELELPVNSVHTPFFKTIDEARAGRWLSLTSRDPDTRRESIERAAEAIAIAEFVPVENAVLHVGKPEEKLDGGTFDRLFYSLEEIKKSAEQFTTKLALENITNDISRGHQIARFVEECGLPDIGCCYDCGHAELYERAIEELNEMATWLLTTHIHDVSDGLDNHLPPFEGQIDWPELASAFAKLDYEGALIIETKDEAGEYASLTNSAKAGKRLRDIILENKERDQEK